MHCVAVCCGLMQGAAVCCSVLHRVHFGSQRCIFLCHSVMQCVAARCSVLQCVAVCCSELQCVALCCTVSISCPFRHLTLHFFVLQCVGV